MKIRLLPLLIDGLITLRTRIALNQGETLSFDEESKRLFSTYRRYVSNDSLGKDVVRPVHRAGLFQSKPALGKFSENDIDTDSDCRFSIVR